MTTAAGRILVGGGVAAVAAATEDVVNQGTQLATGLQEEFRPGQTIQAAGIGFVAGSVILAVAEGGASTQGHRIGEQSSKATKTQIVAENTKSVGGVRQPQRSTAETAEGATRVAPQEFLETARGLHDGDLTSDTIRVFRVEGPGNIRLLVDENGNIEIPTVLTKGGIGHERTLFLNFGDEARAQEFFAQRLSQDHTEDVIKSFEVSRTFLEELRRIAVPQRLKKQFPTRPEIADPTKARDQFGLTAEQIEQLRRVIVPGSGRQ